MTPREKANELVDKMLKVYDIYPIAIDCALIAVDEISEHCYEVMKPFWQEVKQELNNYGY